MTTPPTPPPTLFKPREGTIAPDISEDEYKARLRKMYGELCIAKWGAKKVAEIVQNMHRLERAWTKRPFLVDLDCRLVAIMGIINI